VRAAEAWERRAHEVSDLPLRIALGSAMLYHGLSKLRGEGPGQTGAMFESLGIRPGRPWAIATGLAETFAGAAAILGIATRPAALAVLVTQAVAIRKVHAPKGFDVGKGGWEHNLGLIGIALSLLAHPPGAISAHRAARRVTRRSRTWPEAAFRHVRPTLGDRALALLH
jgi:putative oxidoreductase